MKTVVRDEQPQLVVLGGDVVSGAFWDGQKDWFATKCVRPSPPDLWRFSTA